MLDFGLESLLVFNTFTYHGKYQFGTLKVSRCQSFNCSTSLHQSVHPSFDLGSFSRDTDLKIPRQLASSRRFSVKANPGQGPAYSWLRHLINLEKLNLKPSQRILYLGMFIDTTAARVFSAVQQLEKFRNFAQSFLSKLKQPTCQWQIILGYLSSMKKLVPHGQLLI